MFLLVANGQGQQALDSQKKVAFQGNVKICIEIFFSASF